MPAYRALTIGTLALLAPASVIAGSTYLLPNLAAFTTTVQSKGDPRTFVYEGQEIKTCCKPCERKFLKDPQKYVEKLVPKKILNTPAFALANRAHQRSAVLYFSAIARV